MNATHTPGPWKRGEIRNNKIVTDHGAIDESTIVELPTRWHREPAELDANVALIIAAPDLLEACKLAFERLPPKGSVKKCFSEHLAYAALGKAIHKAEGGEA